MNMGKHFFEYIYRERDVCLSFGSYNQYCDDITQMSEDINTIFAI